MSEHKYWRHRWSPQHVTTVDMTGTMNAPQWEPVHVLNDAELAARLTPTREQIADLLDAHNYDYNQSACRGCDYVNNNGDHDFGHLADVLLDLITRAAK